MAATTSPKEVQRVTLNNVRIIWTNFEGEVGGQGKGMYNKYLSSVDEEGKPIPQRTFNVVLTEEMANNLRDMGAKIRVRPPQNDNEETLYTMTVYIGRIFDNTIWRIIPAGRMALNKDTIGCLDHERIEKANVGINLVKWENTNGSGWKAWCRQLGVWIEEDEFLKSLGDAPIIGAGGGYEIAAIDAVDPDDELPF